MRDRMSKRVRHRLRIRCDLAKYRVQEQKCLTKGEAVVFVRKKSDILIDTGIQIIFV